MSKTFQAHVVINVPDEGNSRNVSCALNSMIETDTSKGLEQQVLRKCEILKQKQGIRQLMRSSNSVQLSFLETLLSSSTHKI
jgi:hypothetical protein